MTIPAMAPPDRDLDPPAAATPAGVEEAEGTVNVTLGVIVGRTTPTHRSSALEL